MRHGQVTPVTEPAVTPVVYLDLDIVPATEDEQADEITADEICTTTPFPGVHALLLTEHGPAGGNPIYRIEGPLPQLVHWLKNVYGADTPEGNSLAFYVEQLKLAR